MTTSKKRLGTILDLLDELAGALGTQANKKKPDYDYVFDHYADSTDEVNIELQQIALGQLEAGAPSSRQSSLSEPDSYLDHARGEVGQRMKKLFGGRVDEKYLKVPTYIWSQRVILELLAQNVGKPVRSTRIRALLCQQVHSERRMRELRDLGFTIENEQHEGKSFYRLTSLTPDLDWAARFLLDRNIRKDTSVSAKARCLLLLKAELGRPVHTTRLSKVSRDQGHYDKRIRELPYIIYTHLTHKDVPTNHYLLVSLTEKKGGEDFSPTVRGQILKRDNHCCRKCGWSPAHDEPDNPSKKYINVHHVKSKKEGGGNTVENGITLCNLCHSVLHPKGIQKLAAS